MAMRASTETYEQQIHNDDGRQFNAVQEHMGFTGGFNPTVGMTKNAFGVPELRGFTMPRSTFSFGKSPGSYGRENSLSNFGKGFNPTDDMDKNAFGVPELRGFRMSKEDPTSIDPGAGDGLTQNQPGYKGFWHGVLNPMEAHDRFKLLRTWGHEFYPRQNNFDPYSDKRHATVSNFLTKEYGPTFTRIAGVVNEVQGLVMHDIPDLPGRIRGERPWAFQLNDLRANEVGIQEAVREMESRK
jgi:hypothetical protein